MSSANHSGKGIWQTSAQILVQCSCDWWILTISADLMFSSQAQRQSCWASSLAHSVDWATANCRLIITAMKFPSLEGNLSCLSKVSSYSWFNFMIYGRKHGLTLVTLTELEAKALFFQMLFIFCFVFMSACMLLSFKCGLKFSPVSWY